MNNNQSAPVNQVGQEGWKNDFKYWLTTNLHITRQAADLIIRHVEHYYNPAASSGVEEGFRPEESDRPFYSKHFANINEKMIEAHIQAGLQHLQHPPQDASVKYFLETGTVNGNFLLAVKALFDNPPRKLDVEKVYEGVEKKTDWMSHPKWDEIHDQLKDEGYSTGSEEDYDKLYAELKKRILALSGVEDKSQDELWREIIDYIIQVNRPAEELIKKYIVKRNL